jgi:hypothetical protein
VSFVQPRVHVVISKKGYINLCMREQSFIFIPDKYTFPSRALDSTSITNADLDAQKDSLVNFYGLT